MCFCKMITKRADTLDEVSALISCCLQKFYCPAIFPFYFLNFIVFVPDFSTNTP